MTILKCAPHTARMIIINIGDELDTNYRLLPGGPDAPAVEVPESVLQIDFVKSLIKLGDIVVVHQFADEEPEVEMAGVDIDSLRKQCDLLGIEYTRKWDEAKLQMAIDAATK
jgi:hypothetical protein